MPIRVQQACFWRGSDQPRAIIGHHEPDCADDYCRGCQECLEPHCRVCGRTHAEQTCAECVAVTRDDLRTIASMCDALPEEVEHRGVQSEALMLLGPAADPEAWGHLTASVRSGRIPRGYLGECAICHELQPCHEHADGEQHPLFVLGRHEMIWREHLDQPTALRATLPRIVDFLDRQLHVMAAEEHVPFDDFARDLRQCRAHLESVLHDSRRGDLANVGCFDCGDRLERRIGDAGFEDFWTCRGCHRRYTSPEYNFALRAKLEEAMAQEESA